MGLKKVKAHWERNRKRWRVNGQRDGERRTFYSFTPGLRGKKEAERKANSWKKGVLHENSDPSVAELWSAFSAIWWKKSRWEPALLIRRGSLAAITYYLSAETYESLA